MKWKIFIVVFLFWILPAYAGSLNVGITGDNPPFCSTADQSHHYYGFDMEIMDQLGKRLNQPINYIVMSFHQLFTAIDNETIDLAIDSIIITPQREKDEPLTAVL
ncbi:transporter substrate-binding domain-containing protein [Legionella impletisoli]|uniref:Solute-binding protein family 3/N-terminal domain-containing protein n=1 Tax=Legionella impletisoli TaxID=343510 RepID=A0A917JQ53_9GAMM|nr:transporter substrate-binding domain-containing protein [Legionella impletisoli]GGI78076.1 hypothetical protein GCM10007966_03460 [Legionella impletisoli]